MAPAGGGYEKDTTRIQGGGVAAVMSACASILSKSAEFAVVAGADATMYDDPLISNASYDIFCRRPIGLFNIPSYALVSAALLRNDGLTERDFALAAAKNYQAAAQNPHLDSPDCHSNLRDEIVNTSENMKNRCIDTHARFRILSVWHHIRRRHKHLIGEIHPRET